MATVTVTEFCYTKQLVRQFYQKLLGREPDSGGFNYWVGQVYSNNNSIEEVENAFRTCTEGINWAASHSVPSAVPTPMYSQSCDYPLNKTRAAPGPSGQFDFTKQALDSLYRMVLGRAPDQSGFDWWVSQIRANVYTLNDIHGIFYTSSEGQAYAANHIIPAAPLFHAGVAGSGDWKMWPVHSYETGTTGSGSGTYGDGFLVDAKAGTLGTTTGTGTGSSSGSSVLAIDGQATGFDFGTIGSGQSRSIPVRYRNASLTQTLRNVRASFTGPFGFAPIANSMPASYADPTGGIMLPPDGEWPFYIEFRDWNLAPGDYVGSLTIHSGMADGTPTTETRALTGRKVIWPF